MKMHQLPLAAHVTQMEALSIDHLRCNMARCHRTVRLITAVQTAWTVWAVDTGGGTAVVVLCPDCTENYMARLKGFDDDNETPTDKRSAREAEAEEEAAWNASKRPPGHA